jgi:hypothetical protein
LGESFYSWYEPSCGFVPWTPAAEQFLRDPDTAG